MYVVFSPQIPLLTWCYHPNSEGDRKYASSCCHDDNGKPRKGMGRISTEFSAASDVS